MKVLKIVASALPLFSSDLEFDFLALQRVSSDAKESLHCLSPTITRTTFFRLLASMPPGKPRS